jgi:FkbM family methyltransferase
MLGPLKRTVGSLAESLGYTIIPNWQLDTYPIARYMHRLFDFLDIDLVLDVGANKGQYYELLRQQVGYQGQVISFEPVPHLATDLQKKAVNSSRWQVEGLALGSSSGSLDFNVMRNTEMSSFLRPDHSRVGDLFSEHSEIEQVVQVEVSTVDTILPKVISKYGSKNVFLKLDTQGFDLEVLKGASASLAGIAALQSEISMTAIYAGMPSYHEVIQFLEDQDFAVSGIYPNNFVFFPRGLEFDCYMINRTRIPQDMLNMARREVI